MTQGWFQVLLAALLVTSGLGVAVAPAAASPSDCNSLSEYETTDAYRQCLVENTSPAEITEIVHTHPDDATQKQIDAVYAVSPEHDDQFGFNETQRRHITQWMTWEKTGLEPDWYQDNTTDGSEETDASEPSGPQTKQTRLAIDTPDYVPDSETIRRDGKEVYVINSREAIVQPQNFRPENVLGFGVVGGVGQLSYDEQLGVYRYDSGGETVTTQLYWEVEETVQSGNTTETVRTRYVATLRADSNATYEHYESGRIEELQEHASNWEEWERALTDIWGDDVDIESKTQASVWYNKVKHNPVAGLSGGFTAQLFALFATLGGLLVLALFGTYHLYTRYGDILYIHRNESLKAEEKEIDEKHQELNWREKMRSVPKWDWSDFFGDLVARAYQAIGRTPYQGLKRLVAARRPRNLVEHRIQAMGHDGYVGVVEREDVATDGGDDAAPAIVGAEVVQSGRIPSDAETVDLTELDPGERGEFIDALDWSDQTLWNYDLRNSDASPDAIHVEQAPVSLEELADALGADLMQFESRKHWGKYLLEFVEYVREHEICDTEGRPDDIQLILSEWMDADDMLSDGFELPHFKAESEAIEWAVKHSDPVEEADRTIENVQKGIADDD